MGDRDIETGEKVEYTLKKTYVLGIGGLSSRARNTNVMDKLFQKADLQKNEALAYVTQSKNINAYALGIVVVVKERASGYVVRPVGFKSAEVDNPQVVREVKETPILKEHKKEIKAKGNNNSKSSKVDDTQAVNKDIAAKVNDNSQSSEVDDQQVIQEVKETPIPKEHQKDIAVKVSDIRIQFRKKELSLQDILNLIKESTEREELNAIKEEAGRYNNTGKLSITDYTQVKTALKTKLQSMQ